MKDTKQHEGLSLRTIHIWILIGTVLVSALMLYSNFDLFHSSQRLVEVSEQQIELRKAARELMDASDYLTEKVQRFTAEGDRRFLEEYFAEALEARRREEAIDRMTAGNASPDALAHLQAAWEDSRRQMNREYYAMRLVMEAKGYTDFPEPLQAVSLSARDKTLSPEEMMLRATEIVLDDEYFARKTRVRENIWASLDELEKMAYDTDASALELLRGKVSYTCLVILLETVGIFFMVWLTSRLSIYPVLDAVDHIRNESPLPEIGANEFRYLARTYNKMFEIYKSSFERVNFKASHDELTGAYNRAGYELLLSSLDLRSVTMLLFDLDNFKSINDTYGHETGDKVLIRLVQVLKNNFRPDDYICRIGGDEFAVFMTQSASIDKAVVVQKIEDINIQLSKAYDGLPPISVSVGIARGDEAVDRKSLFEKTDAALYQSKKNGKRTYTFYAEQLE